MNRIFSALVILSFFSFGSLKAWDNDTFFDLTTGFRFDELGSTVRNFSAVGALVSTSDLKIKHFTTFHIGLKGKYTLPCTGFYTRGVGSFGMIHGNGRYVEDITTTTTSFTISGNIRRGTTFDFDGGVGYLYNIGRFWKIGPIIGYSYDYIRTKMNDLSINDIIGLPSFNGLKYVNVWQGPWIGVDVVYDNMDRTCWNYVITAGYEFHYANWRGTWRLPHGDTFDGPFSDRRISHNGIGHILFADCRWNFCDCWNIGIGLKLQNWRATKGNLTPLAGSFAAVSSTVASAKVPKAYWQSIGFMVDLGFNF